MLLPVPTVAELAEFTGRPEPSFPAFAPEALEQADLMFSIVTKLAEYPAEPDLMQLAKNAIMELADRMILEQPYYATLAGPFQSETIGSYSYSKASASAKTAMQGKTGLFWWDLAVDELTVAGTSGHAHGAIAIYNDGLQLLSDGTFKVKEAAEYAGACANGGMPYIRIS